MSDRRTLQHGDEDRVNQIELKRVCSDRLEKLYSRWDYRETQAERQGKNRHAAGVHRLRSESRVVLLRYSKKHPDLSLEENIATQQTERS